MKTHKVLMYANIARTIATYGTCKRLQVGSVIVKNDCIIGTGFNGSARGEVHCQEAGCEEQNGHCVRCVHSEANAIINAARNGVSTLGAEIVCTHQPCSICLRHIINAGIVAVYYLEAYGTPIKEELAKLIVISEI